MTASASPAATIEPRRQWYAVGAVAVAAAALMLANRLGFILPRHDLRSNRQYAIAAGVAARTDPADVVVTHYDDLLYLYLRYFAQRAVVITSNRDPSSAVPAALARATASGGRVYVVDLAIPTPPVPFTPNPDEPIAGAPFWSAQ